MDEQEPTRRRGWKLTLVLLVSTVLCVGTFPILLLALAMVPMLFDAAGSEQLLLPWLSAALVVATPVVCLAGATGGWLAYILNHTRTAWIFALVPLPLLLVYALMFGRPLLEQRRDVFSDASAATAPLESGAWG
ncbi:MAG TPA: hypothetical protein VF699_07150 [Caulobacteraceae bacterium]